MEPIVALTSPEHQVDRLKCDILAALSQLGDTTVSADIEAMRTHHDYFLRLHAVWVAVDDAHRRGADYANVFDQFFSDRRQEVREEAISYAISHPDEKFIPTMASLFHLHTPPIPDASRADPLAQAQHDLLEMRNARKRSIAKAFVLACRSQDPECLAPVLAAIADPTCSIPGRIQALQSLAYPNSVPGITRHLLGALDDPDKGLHSYAARSLQFVQDADVVLDTLVERLASTDRPEVVRHPVLYAIACLADRYPERCVPILERYLDKPGFQGSAVYGLQRAGARKDIPQLRALYESLARTSAKGKATE